MTGTAYLEGRRTVTAPYQDPQGKVSRAGEREWWVTVWAGCIVETFRFGKQSEAFELTTEKTEAGFELT
jgi:hypothetical protein